MRDSALENRNIVAAQLASLRSERAAKFREVGGHIGLAKTLASQRQEERLSADISRLDRALSLLRMV